MTMNKLKITALTALSFVGLALVAGIAFAGTGAAVGDGDPLGDILRAVFEAFRGGDYPEAGALALVAAVAVARRYGSKYWPALASTEGALILVGVGAFGTSLAAQLAGPATLTGAMFWAAAKVAGGAVGGFTAMAKLVMPLLRRLQSKLPGFLGKGLGALLDVFGMLFERPAAVVIAKAELAGRKAVAANPGAGAEAIVGKLKEFK